MLKIEKLPAPSGKFPVGFYHTSLVDPSRTVEQDGLTGSPRELPIMAWYPAASVKGCPPKPYMPEKAFQLNYDLHFGMINGLPWPLNLYFKNIFQKIGFAEISTNAYIDAPLLVQSEKFPLLVFFQGYTSLMTQNTILLEELASHGYVVLSIGVPRETVTEYPDGRITGVFPDIAAELAKKDGLLTKNLLNKLKRRKKLSLAELDNFTRLLYVPNKNEVNPKMTEYNNFVHGRMKVWYQDLLFVLDHLDDLALFAHKLATDRVGVLGMSMGGGLASCAAYYADPRIAAALSLDGCHYGMPYDAGLKKPHMNIHGYDTSRLLFEKTEKDVYIVTVDDTEHLDYMDYTYLEPVYKELTYTGKKVVPLVMLEIMNRYGLAFFDKYVRGMDTDVFLKGKSPFGNITVEYK